MTEEDLTEGFTRNLVIMDICYQQLMITTLVWYIQSLYK